MEFIYCGFFMFISRLVQYKTYLQEWFLSQLYRDITNIKTIINILLTRLSYTIELKKSKFAQHCINVSLLFMTIVLFSCQTNEPSPIGCLYITNNLNVTTYDCVYEDQVNFEKLRKENKEVIWKLCNDCN